MVSKEKVSRRENPFTNENVTDRRTGREPNVDPNIRDIDKIGVETPRRKEQDMEICLVCQTLHLLNAKCPTCGYSREDIKKRAFSRFHATGSSGE